MTFQVSKPLAFSKLKKQTNKQANESNELSYKDATQWQAV